MRIDDAASNVCRALFVGLRGAAHLNGKEGVLLGKNPAGGLMITRTLDRR
jgi:hypothetical protein